MRPCSNAAMDEPIPWHASAAKSSLSKLSDSDFMEILSGELPRIQRLARLLNGNVDMAEDIVAEAIARSLPKWRAGGVADLSSYIRVVVVNLSTSRWRRRAIARRRDHLALGWLTAGSDIESLISERERTARAVMRLPVRRRAVVVLRFYDDLAERQIAEILGVSVGTVKSQLSRALEQLRVDLETLEGA